MKEDNTRTVSISEDKFNATATFDVVNAKNLEEAEAMAERFFRDEYGHSPSKVVGKEEEYSLSTNRYVVMVADHSSGSLKDNRQYER